MKKKNILVVDDDVICHFMFEKMFASFDLIGDVENAYDGREALRLMIARCEGQARLPDVIFLDIEMPSMDGLQFLDELHALQCLGGRQKNILIAIVTSSLDPGHHAKAKSMGIQHFIAKPPTFEKVQQLVIDASITN
jgi:CheY-like chemotaxis protein